MGLLDIFDTPGGRTGLALLAAGSPTAQPMGLGQRLAMAVGSMDQWRNAAEEKRIAEEERRRRAAMQDMQMMQLQMAMKEAQRKQAQDQQAHDFLANIPGPEMQASQQALSAGGGPTVANAQAVRPMDPAQKLMLDAVKAGALPLQTYLGAMQKDNTPMVVGADASLVSREGRPLFTNVKPEKVDPNKPFMYINGEITPNPAYQQYAKDLAQAGSTRVNVPVNVSTEKKYGEQFAGKVADADVSLMETARKAPDLLDRARRVKSIMAGGSAITGIGADWRLAGAKALSALGVQSAGNAAADTEMLGQQLASNTLDMIRASGLGGGTGFSNADRDFLEKAQGGKITLEARSIIRLADLSERAANLSIQKWNKRVQTIPRSALEGTGIDLQPVPLPTGSTIKWGDLP